MVIQARRFIFYGHYFFILLIEWAPLSAFTIAVRPSAQVFHTKLLDTKRRIQQWKKRKTTDEFLVRWEEGGENINMKSLNRLLISRLERNVWKASESVCVLTLIQRNTFEGRQRGDVHAWKCFPRNPCFQSQWLKKACTFLILHTLLPFSINLHFSFFQFVSSTAAEKRQEAINSHDYITAAKL